MRARQTHARVAPFEHRFHGRHAGDHVREAACLSGRHCRSARRFAGAIVHDADMRGGPLRVAVPSSRYVCGTVYLLLGGVRSGA
jgi:hypothetical protein